MLEASFGSTSRRSECVVVSLVVTREALPLGMFTGVLAIAVNDLPWLLETLRVDAALAMTMLTRTGLEA